MILKFPDLNTLHIVLIKGVVPAAAWGSPAVAGLDEDGALWIDTPAALSKSVQAELKALEVQFAKKNGAAMCANISCWLEMIPLVRNSDTLNPPEQTPVLFDLPSGQQFARMATEILRLGNDRQTFRWLEDPARRKSEGNVRALLRVVGPPYYSLLRAIDAQGPDAPRAFIERAKNVWVQLGYSHPLGEHLKAPAGQMVLLKPPRQWLHLPDAPFRDIYEVLEFALPGTTVGWKEGEVGERLQVPLTLARGGTTEAAELWVLRDDPVNELNNLVQNADDQLLGRLSFAVGEHNGKKTIVLRVRPSKLPPPVLVVKGESFRHYLKLPNLFVPCGWRLHPPLRRDVVRKHLADDSNVLTWLYPAAGGQFVPETLAHDAFRPLTDWIDYVIEHDRTQLQTWVQSTQFDFESFVCNEDEPGKPRKPPAPEKGHNPRGGKNGGMESVEMTVLKMTVRAGKKPQEVEDLDDFANLAKNEPSALQVQLRALEDRFASFEGTLDLPERQALWPELAAVNSALANTEDAGICWANALWSQEETPPAWVWSWFRSEANAVKPEENGRPRVHSWASRATLATGNQREVSGEDLDRVLGAKEPSHADVRALATYLVWAARRKPRPAALMQRLNAVQRFLEANEGQLSVRATWLAWVSFVQLTGGDVLALARARDRLLERLFRGGLRPESDLPSFLRFSGQPTSQRFRAVRSWMTGLCDQAHAWSKETSSNVTPNNIGPTQAYIDLIFAYGLARMGEADASRELLARAKKVLGSEDAAHQFLLEAFDFRLKLAREGKKNSGSLPPEQMEYLEKTMDRMPRYLVDRLRQHSRILEPDQKIDPYRAWSAKIGDLDKALAELADLSDRKEIETRVHKLLREAPKGNKGQEVKVKVLPKALDIAPRVGEEFALELLAQLVPVYDALPEARELAAVFEQAALLEKGLFVAAHFDRKDTIQKLVARFHKLLHAQRGNGSSLQALDSLAGQCFRGLRKLGMREEIDSLLRSMQDVILDGQDIAAAGTKADRNWPVALRTLLHVASGWLYFSKDRQAEPILNAARRLLFEGEVQGKDRTLLACAYASAVGQAPVEVAQRRLEELLHKLTGIKDTYTTNTHYSLSQLDVVEAVVLAVVNDDYTMGANARRWLDDDEFIVRRRIHRDFQAIKAHQS
jgi:hypothetical protein